MYETEYQVKPTLSLIGVQNTIKGEVQKISLRTGHTVPKAYEGPYSIEIIPCGPTKVMFSVELE